jgi:flagellar hook protein FlgE
MGLTSALNTSLNGLALNETSIDVLGNNIANSGTNGFKASSVRFATQLSRTLSVGSRPTATSGGTNPRQIGLGASVSVISRDFTQGSISNSSSPSDLAIQGDGFFILDGPNGRVYSRNGNFSRNSSADLVNDQGMLVLGYAVDDDFNLITTQLDRLNIPIGELNVAQQTTQISLSGALLPTGELGEFGSINVSEVLTDTSTAAPATAASLLVDLENVAGDPLFTAGETLNFTPRKGGRTVEPVDLLVTATTTLQELMDYLDETLAIQSGGTIPNDVGTGGQPGVSLSGGQITIVGNSGDVNDVIITVGDLLSDTNVVPITFLKTQTANGHSTGTDFVVYDSLGQPVNVRISAVLESRAPSQTIYRWYLEAPDDSRSDVAIATGQLEFDSLGNVSNGGNVSFSLERTNTAAVSPMQIAMDLSQISGISTIAAGSRLNLQSQDGTTPGTLQSFVIDENGIINGVFDNGVIRTLGQVVLARFANPDGLIEDGSTTFKEGVSSGAPALTTPGTFGVGTIRAGAIELSNTDIGKSLVDLIVASTNYRGNARVISSVQQLVDELLVLGR